MTAARMIPLDRVLLLAMCLLAGYLVVIGIDDFSALPIIAYTVAFGILIIAGLLWIILGVEVLDSPLVVILATAIPLALSLGIVWQYFPSARAAYLIFVILGFLAIITTRGLHMPGKPPLLILILVHGVAGLAIFLLPLLLVLEGAVKPAFALVALGGGLIGVGGLLLSFLKAGRPILSREKILRILPGLLLLMTACFAAGFRFG